MPRNLTVNVRTPILTIPILSTHLYLVHTYTDDSMQNPSTHLKTIRRFFHQKKRMPSYAEIAKLLGFRSKNAAFKLVRKLVAEHILQKDESGKLIPGRQFQTLQLLGTIGADFPSPADEELLDTMSLDEY